jgi:tetratricopeptide (TPR) repeat protein
MHPVRAACAAAAALGLLTAAPAWPQEASRPAATPASVPAEGGVAAQSPASPLAGPTAALGPGLAASSGGGSPQTAAATSPSAESAPAGAGGVGGAGAPPTAPAAAAGSASPPAVAPAGLAAVPIGPLEATWQAPAAGLVERVERERRIADHVGVDDLDPLARALLIDTGAGSPLERASAAVRLAPDLPAAWYALGIARWQAGEGAASTARALLEAVAALGRHLASRLWLEASVLVLLYASLLLAGLGWIAIRGLSAATHAAHDLGHPVDPSMPGFAKAAAVAALVLVPAVLGAGPIGAAAVLLGIGIVYGDARGRRSLVAAAVLVGLALGPLAEAAARRLEALTADPVALASWESESGFVDPVDAARIDHADPDDVLALLARARGARRAGDLARADALLAELLSRDPKDPLVLNDAASVKLERGDAAGAIALYEQAIAARPSALLWFNLAQAHARAIDIEGHDAALRNAQDLDPTLTGVLASRLSNEEPGYVVEMPLASSRIRARLLGRAAPAAAASLRRPVAHGIFGERPWLADGLLLGAALAAFALGRLFAPSRGCLDCGRRLCPRCGTGEPAAALCTACARGRFEARRGGPWDGGRAEPWSLRAVLRPLRRGLGRVVPGLLEREPARPGLALAALVAAATAAALGLGRHGVVPDPASVGGAGPLALGAAAAALALAYALLAARATRAGGRR